MCYKKGESVQTLIRCLFRNSVHTSRSGQDPYVSKGGPLGGWGVLVAVKPAAVLVFLQANSVG